MSAVESEKKIEVLHRKLKALRDEFDRCDANHPAQAIQIQIDIRKCADELEAETKILDQHIFAELKVAE